MAWSPPGAKPGRVRRSMPRASRGVQKHGARTRVWTFNETNALGRPGAYAPWALGEPVTSPAPSSVRPPDGAADLSPPRGRYQGHLVFQCNPDKSQRL